MKWLVEYEHDGDSYNLSIDADSWADAVRRVEEIGATGRVLGEVVQTIEIDGGTA